MVAAYYYNKILKKKTKPNELVELLHLLKLNQI